MKTFKDKTIYYLNINEEYKKTNEFSEIMKIFNEFFTNEVWETIKVKNSLNPLNTFNNLISKYDLKTEIINEDKDFEGRLVYNIKTNKATIILNIYYIKGLNKFRSMFSHELTHWQQRKYKYIKNEENIIKNKENKRYMTSYGEIEALASGFQYASRFNKENTPEKSLKIALMRLNHDDDFLKLSNKDKEIIIKRFKKAFMKAYLNHSNSPA